jgi:hypothetical protein
VFLAARSTARSTWGHSCSSLPVVGTKVITRRPAPSLPLCVAAGQTGRATCCVQLLTILERVDAKPFRRRRTPSSGRRCGGWPRPAYLGYVLSASETNGGCAARTAGSSPTLKRCSVLRTRSAADSTTFEGQDTAPLGCPGPQRLEDVDWWRADGFRKLLRQVVQQAGNDTSEGCAGGREW